MEFIIEYIKQIGLQDMFQKFFLEFDMFGASPSFRMRGQPQTVNLCGGITSLLLVLFFFYIFIIQTLDIINYQEIQAITTIAKNLRQNQTEEVQTMFAIGVRGLQLNHLQGFFQIEANIVQGINRTRTQIPLQLQVCTEAMWAPVGERVTRAFNRYSMSEKLCPKLGQKVNFIGLWNNQANGEQFRNVEISLAPCVNKTNSSNCYPASARQKFFNDYLAVLNYIIFDFFYLSAAFNPSSKDPLIYYIQDHIYLTFTNVRGAQAILQIALYDIETDVSMTPVIQKQSLTGSFVENYLFGHYDIHGVERYVQIVILLGAQDFEVEREYGKVDDKLSYVGGLFGLVIAFMAFFLMSFNEYRYQLFVGQTFSFDDGNSIKEKQFTFMQYLKYSFYDWVKTLGCCEPDWEDCKKIDQAREEANQQIDVQILLKRISHLEQLVKFFVDEEEDLCTYLTEGQYIDQVRKRRQIIHYYDKIIQGNSPLTIQNMYAVENLLTLKTQLLSSNEDDQSQNNESIVMKESPSFRNMQADEKLQEALKRGGRFYDTDDEELDLDDDDRQIQALLSKAFYKLPKRSREKIQEKIPLKILKRLKNEKERSQERERMWSQYSFFKNMPKKKKS